MGKVPSLLAPKCSSRESPEFLAGGGGGARPPLHPDSHRVLGVGTLPGWGPSLSFASPGPTPRGPRGSRAASGPRTPAQLERGFSVAFMVVGVEGGKGYLLSAD